MTLYKRIFENTLENPNIDPQIDAQTFQQGFNTEEEYEQVNGETQNISLSEEEIEALIQKSKMYNEKIKNFIVLLSKIQEDVVRGPYKNIPIKGLDKFAGIIKDLQELGTDLTAGVGDGFIRDRQQQKGN